MPSPAAIFLHPVATNNAAPKFLPGPHCVVLHEFTAYCLLFATVLRYNNLQLHINYNHFRNDPGGHRALEARYVAR